MYWNLPNAPLQQGINALLWKLLETFSAYRTRIIHLGDLFILPNSKVYVLFVFSSLVEIGSMWLQVYSNGSSSETVGLVVIK